MTEDTYNDLYPVQLKDPELPIQEDCASEFVPPGTTDMEGKKKVLVPELITMTKVLFDRYRLDMYTYLNNCLHTGGLAAIIGKPIKTRVINHEICTFPGVNYWRIDRANFFADVTVELKLQTNAGPVDWKGCLTCWCGFDDNGLFVSIEDLSDSVDRKDEGLNMLSPYLVPYVTNKRVDEISEALWKRYLPEALDDPKQRIAAELVNRMGLTIEFHPAFKIFDWVNKKREKGFYNCVVGVTALGRKQLEIAKQRTGNRSIPSRLIYNSIYVDEFRKAMNNECTVELPEKQSDWIWCIYAGSLNPSYDIPTVVECARKCEEENRRVLFIIVGGGEYADLCKKNINDHFLYLGFQDSKILPSLYAKCDIGLCTYADFSTVDMPDKFYDYTAAGLAIINSLKGESKDYVEGRGLGVQYEAGDPEDLYEKVCRFEDADYLAECKKNSWNIGEEFDFGKQIDKLKTLIDEII